MLLEDREARRAGRRATLLAAVALAVVGALVAAAVVFLVRRGDDSPPRASAPGPGETLAPSATSTPPRSELTLTLRDVTWQDYFGVPLPTSAAGPRDTSGGRARGFSHSAPGAVLAAVHISVRITSSVGPSIFVPTIQEQMTGVDQAKFLANAQENYTTSKARYGAAPGGEIPADIERAVADRSRSWAYRVDAYDSSVVSMHLLGRSVPQGADPVYVDFAYTLRWIGDDWRLVAPLNADWRSVATTLKDVPQGYTVIGRP